MPYSMLSQPPSSSKLMLPNAFMADLNIPSSHPSSEEVNQHLQEDQLVELNPTQPPPSSPATTQNNRSTPPPSGGSDRKPRGRPLGSRNKPKPPVLVPQPAMKTVQLEILPNCDIVDMVEKFARKHHVGLHILNGSGCISSLILRHPPITLSGVFNLVSVAGTFTNGERAVPSFHHGGSLPWLTIFIGGNTWEVAGGAVVSKAVAATNVVLNVMTFKTSEFYQLSPAVFDGEEQQQALIGGNFSGGTIGATQVGIGMGGNGQGVPAAAVGFPSAANMPPLTVANIRATATLGMRPPINF